MEAMPAAPPVPRYSRRHAEVLNAAAQVFFEKGYEATSIADIGERCGLLKGSLYYYIRSKDELLYEVVKDVFGRRRLMEELAEGSTPERLLRFVEGHVLYLTQNITKTAVFLHDYRSLSPQRRKLAKQREQEYVAAVTQLIEEGQADGSFRREVDPKLATFAVLGAINWVYRWYRDGAAHTPEEIGQEFAEIIVRGLVVDPEAVPRRDTTTRATGTAVRDSQLRGRRTTSARPPRRRS
jgi:AcrR family transcriptional regulator